MSRHFFLQTDILIPWTTLGSPQCIVVDWWTPKNWKPPPSFLLRNEEIPDGWDLFSLVAMGQNRSFNTQSKKMVVKQHTPTQDENCRKMKISFLGSNRLGDVMLGGKEICLFNNIHYALFTTSVPTTNYPYPHPYSMLLPLLLLLLLLLLHALIIAIFYCSAYIGHCFVTFNQIRIHRQTRNKSLTLWFQCWLSSTLHGGATSTMKAPDLFAKFNSLTQFKIACNMSGHHICMVFQRNQQWWGHKSASKMTWTGHD